MRAVLRFALGISLLLLLLSALVTGGEPETAAAAALPRAPVCSVCCMPRTEKSETSAACDDSRAEAVIARMSVLLDCENEPRPPAETDANGRVLRTLRYSESVYALFRPEWAAG